MRKKFEYSIGQKANRALIARLNYRQSLRSDDARHYRVYKRRSREYRQGGSNQYFIADSRDGRIVEDDLTIKALSSLEQGHILVGVDGIKPNTRADYYGIDAKPFYRRRNAGKKEPARKMTPEEYQASIRHLHGPVRSIVVSGVPTMGAGEA
jgi:hypothetical protein